MAQWVKVLACLGSIASSIWAQGSGLRMWHCCSCGVGCRGDSDSIPGPGTSICLWGCQKWEN